MTLKEIRDAHFLERIGYRRATWAPGRLVLVVATNQHTPNRRWLVSEPVASQWQSFYLTSEDANATDWEWVPEDVMTNYALSQGLTREEPPEVGFE